MDDPTLINEPPGTVTIEDVGHGQDAVIVLEPTPTDDPNDPLNWSKARKVFNFAIASFYTLATFVLLDIGTVVWIQMNSEIGVSWDNLNNSFAANLAGLAIGCIFLIPFAIKYGRRPIYILSTAFQFATAIWNAKVNSTAELLAVNVVSGLAGAVSEALVQMTIVDIFFVHQRASANSFYNFMVSAGAYLAPVAAGYCATAQGWRWIWWWTAIMLGISLAFFIFGFEESKYIPILISHPGEEVKSTSEEPAKSSKRKTAGESLPVSLESGGSYQKKSYRERMALITKSDNSIIENIKRPIVVLVSFPAVTFTALVWGCFLSWFSIIATTQSAYLAYPPYEYNSSQIGLFNLPPFIGGLFGAALGGPINDWYILWRAKRNNGIFEPETRLHMGLPSIFATPLGLLIFGLGLAKGWPWWSIALGSGIFGFAFFAVGSCALTYLADCYQDIVGDALVAVAFVRNGLSTVFVFALSPWIAATGLANMFIAVACISTTTLLTMIPMILWGKRMRAWTATRYREMGLLQPGTRRL